MKKYRSIKIEKNNYDTLKNYCDQEARTIVGQIGLLVEPLKKELKNGVSKESKKTS